MTSDDKPTKAEMAALAVLAKRKRIMVLLVPEGASDEFCARLSTWNSLLLDLKLLPPVLAPARVVGDGIHCPFCNVGIKADFSNGRIEAHAEDCDWRQAMLRWAYANVQIDNEHKETDACK